MKTELVILALALGAVGCKPPLAKRIKADPRHSPYFRPVAETISFNQQLDRSLGVPVSFGAITVQSCDEQTRAVTFDVKLKGPKGTGHAVVHVIRPKRDGAIVSQGGDFFPSAGVPIHLDPR